MLYTPGVYLYIYIYIKQVATYRSAIDSIPATLSFLLASIGSNRP